MSFMKLFLIVSTSICVHNVRSDNEKSTVNGVVKLASNIITPATSKSGQPLNTDDVIQLAGRTVKVEEFVSKSAQLKLKDVERLAAKPHNVDIISSPLQVKNVSDLPGRVDRAHDDKLNVVEKLYQAADSSQRISANKLNISDLSTGGSIKRIIVTSETILDKTNATGNYITLDGKLSAVERRRRRKKKKKGESAAKILVYQEFNDKHVKQNEIWMKSLDDVVNFFKQYLQYKICYGECPKLV